MTEARDEDGTMEVPTESRRRWVIPTVIIAVVLLLAGGAVLAMYLVTGTGQPAVEQTPTATAPADTSTPSATPAPTPTPTPTGAAQPTDCYEIYGQDFLDNEGTQVLNDPSVSGTDISRYRVVEEIRETLPGIECHWGGATEGGIANAVNTISAPDQARVITLLGENEHVCAPENDGIICRQSETVGGEEGEPIWVLAEEHFFRDGLWVSTWWAAGTDVDISDTTIPMYETIWG